MRRAWCIAALSALLCVAGAASATAPTWSTNTAIPLPEDEEGKPMIKQWEAMKSNEKQ